MTPFLRRSFTLLLFVAVLGQVALLPAAAQSPVVIAGAELAPSQQAQSSYAITIGQAPRTIATSSGVYEIPSGTVAMTELGSRPANITVTVGAQVFWVNNTAAPIRVSNQLLGGQLYLPLVTRPGGQVAANANGGEASALPNLPATETWVSDPIAPGSQYGRLFTAAGVFPYYAEPCQRLGWRSNSCE